LRIPFAAAFILAVSTVAATAQSPLCQRLEAQLASLDRGGVDPARAEQIRRYDETLNRQQYDYDRLNAQARQLDCTRSGFFSIFQQPSPQCNALNRQIEQISNNIARLRTEMQQMSGNLDRAGQRRALLTALGENDCGPQYRSAAAPRTFFDTLFGPGQRDSGGYIYSDETAGRPGGTYRTVCVRTCDGYYYPISFAAHPNRFDEDDRICQRTCPAAQVSLYTYRNPGEDIAQAVSLAGQNYSSLPTAFRYRQQYDAACSCRQPGQSWADAMQESGAASDVERGDIVVTHDRARQMSLPRDGKGRPVKEPASAGTQPSADATSEDAAPGGDGLRGSTPAKRTIRTVGPQFLPVQ
jgi:hypothetical protein